MSESEMSASSLRQKAEAYSREICKRQDLDWDEDHERIENDYYEKTLKKKAKTLSIQCFRHLLMET